MPAPSDGSGDGAQHYQYQALDNAGNASATGNCTVKIDTQGPVVTPTGLQPDDITGLVDDQPDRDALDHNDAGAGVATTYYTRRRRRDSRPIRSPFTVSGTGPAPGRLLGDRRCWAT